MSVVAAPTETALSLPPLSPPKPSADAVVAHVAENHGGTGSERVKSIVFGGLDGVITTFSIVAAVSGSSSSGYSIRAVGPPASRGPRRRPPAAPFR